MKLLSVTKARQIVLKNTAQSRIISCRISHAVGKVLAQNIFADSDQPAADKSAMDGIAISFKASKKGRLQFLIKGVQKAGIAPKVLLKREHCFEIMTGAVIPKNCDCVIPFEDIKIANGCATLKSQVQLAQWQFIRRQASEYKKNKLLLTSGTKINSTHIAVCASVGKSQLKVFSPKIAIVGTGDELVFLDKIPQSHQSRRSNAYALEALLCSHGFVDIKRFHLKDNLAQIKRDLQRIIRDFDVVILSGGVSMGKFDFIPQALNELKIKNLFHKVSQKPGKPFLFAKTSDGKAIFGLPGNPVSTFVCAVYYVLPFLYKNCGADNKIRFVKLASPIDKNASVTFFVPIAFNPDGLALPVTLSSSGNYNALSTSDGFLEIPPGTGSLEKGKEAKFFSW